MSNLVEFVDGDMTEEDRKKIDELLIKIDEENKLPEKTGKLEAENMRLQRKLNESIDDNYKNAWKIQQQAFRGMKYAQKENKRLREALELIAKSNFYFARGEEDKQLRRVCEIARNALNGNEK